MFTKEEKVFVIAELSANHGNKLENALETVRAAKLAGADAIKIQTYTADTITIDCGNENFQIRKNTIWDGRTLYDLYKEAHTPWEWHSAIKDEADKSGIEFFSTPFDLTAVDFLVSLGVPYFKIASFEINDIPLVSYAASKGLPMIISTGIATLSDIQEAVDACRAVGNNDITLLKCTSQYPAPIEQANLLTMVNLRETFGVKVGLSDHTMGLEVALAATALGATIVEKHFTISRSLGGPDASFSMEPHEFREMVNSIRKVEAAIGKVSYDLTPAVLDSRYFSRSLYVVESMKAGDTITNKNVRSIRPGNGMHTRYQSEIIGKKIRRDVEAGTPLSFTLIE